MKYTCIPVGSLFCSSFGWKLHSVICFVFAMNCINFMLASLGRLGRPKFSFFLFYTVTSQPL